jgi:hypothetical protein
MFSGAHFISNVVKEGKKKKMALFSLVFSRAMNVYCVLKNVWRKADGHLS